MMICKLEVLVGCLAIETRARSTLKVFLQGYQGVSEVPDFKRKVNIL